MGCGVGTRSHVLEPAEYESYDAEIIINESDAFASKEWEEVDTVTKYAISQSAIVMCHKCWVKKKTVFERIINANHTKWIEGGMQSIRPVMQILKSLRYMQFEAELSDSTRDKVRELRVMSKGLLTKSTEEE
jgi:hypothetical protein